MNVKILLVFFSAVMLAACGKSDTDLDDVQPAVASKASSTAIFLPGGGGIDFGFGPVIDRSGETKHGAYKSLYYDFKQSVDEVSDSIDKVLQSQGYRKELKKDLKEGVLQEFLYGKEGFNRVAVQYRYHVKEGFQKKTRVLFWWYEQ